MNNNADRKYRDDDTPQKHFVCGFTLWLLNQKDKTFLHSYYAITVFQTFIVDLLGFPEEAICCHSVLSTAN